MEVKLECSLPVKVNYGLDENCEPIYSAHLELITLWRGDLCEYGRTRATAIINLMWSLLELGLIKEIEYK
jgi:hypothetical protein